MFHDQHGRSIGYARIAITDKCNLRCTYCMPKNPLFLAKKDILSFEEVIRILKILIFTRYKKNTIYRRRTFFRKDFIELLQEATEEQTNIKHITITKNGILIKPYIAELKKLEYSFCQCKFRFLKC
ncbi:MAG: radical SAM protein [Chitinophagaceae bacterium]